jgi:enterochelin esterase-like enzyme
VRFWARQNLTHCKSGNRALHAALDARVIPHTYEAFAGAHDWTYWKLHIADTLRFFGAVLRRAAERPGA